MKRIKLFTAALLLAAISAGNDVWALSDSRKKDTRPVESPQFFSGNANPLSDFIFCLCFSFDPDTIFIHIIIADPGFLRLFSCLIQIIPADRKSVVRERV